MTDFKATQLAELASWIADDPTVRQDKRIREIIRYPLLKKQMGLDAFDTHNMDVADVGCGPFGGVSSLLHAKSITRIDPLMDEYKKYYSIENGVNMKAEDARLSIYDLVIITNAMDHFENPIKFLEGLGEEMKPGAFFAHLHAINNAETHPHEAHAHNVNPELFHKYLDKDFETVWYMDYAHDGITYGWRKQPAFSGLYRKVTGY